MFAVITTIVLLIIGVIGFNQEASAGEVCYDGLCAEVHSDNAWNEWDLESELAYDDFEVIIIDEESNDQPEPLPCFPDDTIRRSESARDLSVLVLDLPYTCRREYEQLRELPVRRYRNERTLQPVGGR